MKIYIGVDNNNVIISSGPLEFDGQWFHWMCPNDDNKCCSSNVLREEIREYILSEAGLVNAPVGSIGELEI